MGVGGNLKYLGGRDAREKAKCTKPKEKNGRGRVMTTDDRKVLRSRKTEAGEKRYGERGERRKGWCARAQQRGGRGKGGWGRGKKERTSKEVGEEGESRCKCRGPAQNIDGGVS